MNMKSIRLDFAAEGISVENDALRGILASALLEYASASPGHVGFIASRMALAVKLAEVEEYDDRTGSPVFYIP